MAANLERVNIGPAGLVTLHLTGGGRIYDRGDRVTLVGRASEQSVTEMITAADRKGWTERGVELSGSVEFRRAAAVALLSRRPPVGVTGLDDADRAAVNESLRARDAARRTLALQYLNAEEKKATEALLSRPGSRAEAMRLAAIRDGQMAARSGDQAAVDAALSMDTEAAVKAGVAWRSRMTAKAPEPITGPAPEPVMGPRVPAPAYVPTWARGPRKPEDRPRE